MNPADEHDAEKLSLTESGKEGLHAELKSTEDDTLRIKHANEEEAEAGDHPVAEDTARLTEGIRSVKESEAFHVTNDLIHQATDALTSVETKVSSNIGQLRNTIPFKSFDERVGSTYTSVNHKIATSTSSERLASETATEMAKTTTIHSQSTTPSAAPS